MAGELRAMRIVIGAKIAEFNQAMKTVRAEVTATERKFASFEAIGKRLQSFGKAWTIGITLPVALATKKVVDLAAEAQETENLFKISMKGMAGAATEWAEDLSKSLGLNKYGLMQNVGMLNNMFTALRMGTQTSYDMATGLTELSHDMASFYNLPHEEAMQKLQSGIMGQVRPLREIGILVDEQTIKQYAYKAGIVAVGEQMTQQQKVQARYLAIMDQTKNAQGDLERTAGDLTNQWRRMKESGKELGADFGKVLLPAVTGLAKWANNVITAFKGLSDGQKKVAVTTALLVGAVGPLIFLGGTAIRMLRSLHSNAELIKGTLGKLLTGAINPMTIALAAVVAVGILVYKNWDTVKRVGLNVWGTLKQVFYDFVAGTIERWATFIAFFSKTQADRAREYAESLRQMADAEHTTIEQRNLLAAEAAEAKRQQLEAERLAKEAAEAKMLAGTAGYYDDELDMFEDALGRKVDYLDEFKDAFDRSQEDMVGTFKRAQEDATTEFKYALEDRKIEFKRALEDERLAYKRHQQDLVLEFKRRQDAEMDALKASQDAQLRSVENRYNRQIELLSGQQDAIRGQADAEKRAEDHEKALDRIAAAEANLQRARASGRAWDIYEAEVQLAEAVKAQQEMLKGEQRQDAISAIDEKIKLLEQERNSQIESLRETHRRIQDELDLQHEDLLIQYKRELEDLERVEDEKWDARQEAFERQQEQTKTNWDRAQEDQMIAYKRELEDLETSFAEKLVAQAAFVRDWNAMVAQMQALMPPATGGIQPAGAPAGESIKVTPLATGGVVKKPTLALIAERKPEVVTSLEDYRNSGDRATGGTTNVILQSGAIQVEARNLQEMQNVIELFESLPQAMRATTGGRAGD